MRPLDKYTHKLLNGRNRLLACKEAGVKPLLEEFFRTAIAAETLLPSLAVETKERQLAGAPPQD